MRRFVTNHALVILLGLLFFSVILSIYLLIDRNSRLITSNNFPLLDPAAVFVKDQDFLVRFQPLREAMQTQYENHPDFHVGLYFEYLPTGSSISVNKDRKMWPASLIKIPVAMAVLKKVERGEWSLQNELVVMDVDKDPSFGDLYQKPTGTTLTIDQLLQATLIDSDNTAHYILLRNLDNDDLEEVFLHLGLEDILSTISRSAAEEPEDNRMTAKTYSIFFRSLFNATYISPEMSEKFLTYLVNGRDEYLKNGLPEGVLFAHKTGVRAEDGVWVDSGIVYEDRRPYMLTVMLERRNPDSEVSPEVVQSLFTEISSQIHSYVKSL